jgi:hypothetical protein
MILPLQMFDITQYLTKIKCHQFIYLFIQIQILIGFQPNRFVTKYSQPPPKVYGTNQKHALRFPLFVHFEAIRLRKFGLL